MPLLYLDYVYYLSIQLFIYIKHYTPDKFRTKEIHILQLTLQ